MKPALLEAHPQPPDAIGETARRPRNPTRGERRVLVLGIALGLATFLLPAVVHLAGSPFSPLEWLPVVLLLPLALVQVFFSWYLYLRVSQRIAPPPPRGLSVDVFVTACGEPPWMVSRSLRAAVAIRYPHATWLLDDGPDPRLEVLAHRLGAGYLTRPGRKDHKAGNVNAALRRTRGEFVAILDVDHVPEPDFLDRMLGCFREPRVGFVQSMLTFSNRHDSLIAQASAQTGYEYYNLLAVGKDRCGAAGLMGSNAILRRAALDSIGGYHPGLAEDLETSLRLHAAGWHSAYICEALAPGLTPADLGGFFKQQSKWATGVWNAALRSFPHVVRRLTRAQRLAYGLRFTNYLVGPLLAIHMLATAVGLFLPFERLEIYLGNVLPFVLISILLRSWALRRWASDPEARHVCWKGMSLICSSWPVYATALARVLARRPMGFVATPKVAVRGGNLRLLIPQLTMVGALAVAIGWRLLHWQQAATPFLLAWGGIFLAAHGIVLRLLLVDRPPVSAAMQEPTGDVII